MDIKTLRLVWLWTFLFAVVVSVILFWIGGRLEAASGYGILHLEFSRNAADVQAVLYAWKTAGVTDLAAFMIGFDYLYMPLYGLALFCGSMVAREVLATSAANWRRVLTWVAIAPLAAAGFDAIENLFEVQMVLSGSDLGLAGPALVVTVIKFVLAAVGGAGAVAGLYALIRHRRTASLAA